MGWNKGRLGLHIDSGQSCAFGLSACGAWCSGCLVVVLVYIATTCNDLEESWYLLTAQAHAAVSPLTIHVEPDGP